MKKTNLDKILNEALNKALIGRNKIKQVNSNEIADFVNKQLEAINYTHCCTELNNCFKVGENVIYLGVKMKITFVDNLQKTVNMYCMCDETNWEAISLSKLTKII